MSARSRIVFFNQKVREAVIIAQEGTGRHRILEMAQAEDPRFPFSSLDVSLHTPLGKPAPRFAAPEA